MRYIKSCVTQVRTGAVPGVTMTRSLFFRGVMPIGTLRA